MYSLLSHNTFGIDVYAERFQEYASVEELKTLIAQGALTTPFLHIGGGSNLLFVKDYEGLVLHSRIEGIEVTEDTMKSKNTLIRTMTNCHVLWVWMHRKGMTSGHLLGYFLWVERDLVSRQGLMCPSLSIVNSLPQQDTNTTNYNKKVLW